MVKRKTLPRNKQVPYTLSFDKITLIAVLPFLPQMHHIWQEEGTPNNSLLVYNAWFLLQQGPVPTNNWGCNFSHSYVDQYNVKGARTFGILT